jgi:hypothetical protein
LKAACRITGPAALLALISICAAGCHRRNQSVLSAEPQPKGFQVVGATYVTAEQDRVIFGPGGRAVELNGAFGMAYPGQSIYFGADGKTPRTECKYDQTDDKVTLACDALGGANPNARAVYTVNADGSLSGPPAGLWGHAAFAHMTLKK